MRKFAVIMITVLAIGIVFGGNSFAQDDEKNALTLLYLSGEYTTAEERDSFFGYKLFGKHYFPDAGGFGGTWKEEPDNNYWNYKIWGFYPIFGYGYDISLGYSRKNSGIDYVFAGIDHLYRKVKVGDSKINVFFDVKNFFALNDGEDYLDVYTSIECYLGGKFKGGFNVNGAHYWTGPDRQRLLIGPFLQYRVSEGFAVRGRIAGWKEWRSDRPDDQGIQFRIDLKFYPE